MLFTRRLRDGVRRGEITCSVRIWKRPHVVVGKRYRMEEGEIQVDSFLPITYADITPELARASGFEGVVDLLKVAKHGPGEQGLPGAVPLRPSRRGAAQAGPASGSACPGEPPYAAIEEAEGGQAYEATEEATEQAMTLDSAA